QHVVSYPVSHGSFINFIGFKSYPDAEGSTYPGGKWVQDASVDELRDLFVGWEGEVQEMLQVRLFAHRGRFIAILGTKAKAKLNPTITQDAYILGRLLAHPLTTLTNVKEVLRIYQSVRLPFSNTVLGRARETGRMCEFNHPAYYD
ncbi:hypothetical protein POSPLADRAFT_1116951, partial [Postia placenta MAD-698-R-SB12]